MKPEDTPKSHGRLCRLRAALTKDGAMVSSNRLRPTADATTVRHANGQDPVLNGPYAGNQGRARRLFLIEVADKDAALAWAARCPAANHGVVEVRPVWSM